MAKTLEQLLSLSSIIANETKAGANTALRVGGLFSDIIYYLRDLDYAGKDDIPSLEGYATEQWVLGKGYATTSDLDNRIDALVNGAPQAYDTLKEIADVLANNINSIDDILTALGTKVSKDDFNTAIANVNNSISALNTELSGKIGLKLDAVTFNELFEKVQLEDGTWAIKAKLGLFSDGFISAKGSNVGGTSSEGGAVALYQLNDVLADGTGVSGAQHGAVFVYDATIGKWKGIAQSEIVPNLTGYAKESWVLQQGFLTEHQDLSDYAKKSDIPTIPTDDINKGVTAHGWGDHSKVGYLTGITSALVTGALGYTPYDAANFTKANIKSTLGISDWALASSKPSYTTKEVTEDTNLYFTNARAVAALKSITDGLSASITSNTTKITNLTTKVDDHIAVFNSMFKLVELSDGTMSIQALHGLWSDGFISAKGANSSGGSSSDGGLITSLYRYADLGKTFLDTNNDTFNAYTINKINADLGSRISVLEGKATNVSFTQSLTSGTQIGTITIDGASKNIYAPIIPTSDINKGVTAYGWGNHASVGYLTSASSLAWGKITGKPTTISGYGITDALTAFTSSADTNLSITVGGTTKSITNLYARYTERFRVVWDNPSEGTYDLNELLGGYVRYYGSGGTLVNAPESFGYGAVLSLTSGSKALSGQLAWNIKHGNTTDVTKNLYWRVSDSANGYTYAKWHQIAFTDYTYSQSEIDTKLSGYLHLSGGTITNSANYKLTLNATNSNNYNLLGFASNSTVKAYIGTKYENFHIFNSYSDNIYINNYTIIHSGNIGNQSVASLIQDRVTDLNSVKVGTFFQSSLKATNLPVGASNYLTGFSLATDNNSEYRVMLGLDYSGNVFARAENGGKWKDWKTIAFTDSNVASATKLQTARSIWGQSFDGTGNVDGLLTLNYNNSSRATGIEVVSTNGGEASIGFKLNSSTRAVVGCWSDALSLWRADCGTCITIPQSGNVGIGTTSPQYKLDVNGSLNASGAVTFDSTLNVTGQTTLSSVVDIGNAVRMVNGKFIYGRTSANVLHNILGVNANDALLVNYGATSQNSKLLTYGSEFRFTTYSDGAAKGTLAWIDSKLGVGTSAPEYTADIRGTIGVSDAITLRGTTKATANIAFSRSSYNYITFPTDGSLCLSTAISTSGIVLRVTSTAIEPMTTATKSVGTSSKRWGAIYGVDGDFSGTLHATTGVWSDGYVSAKGQNTSSDMRLKNVLNEVVLSVEDIAAAPSMRFSWKNGGGVDVGSSAQYWQRLLPDAVKERVGMLEMQYANIALLSAIAIAKNVETHEERIARLEKENKELRSEIMILKGGSYA